MILSLYFLFLFAVVGIRFIFEGVLGI